MLLLVAVLLLSSVLPYVLPAAVARHSPMYFWSMIGFFDRLY